MELMSIGKFAKAVGVTPTTLRRMQKTGELVPCHISDGGTRYYSTEQLKLFLGNGTGARKEKAVGYCRVSTAAQRDDLRTQVENVRSYMYAKGYQFEIIEDIGSGINYKKKGLMELLDRVMSHEITKVVVLYKDRLVRFGFELVEYVCAANGVEIEIIDNTEQSKERELTDDLIQVITVFANRLYGSRSKKTKKLIDEVKANAAVEKNKVKADT